MFRETVPESPPDRLTEQEQMNVRKALWIFRRLSLESQGSSTGELEERAVSDAHLRASSQLFDLIDQYRSRATETVIDLVRTNRLPANEFAFCLDAFSADLGVLSRAVVEIMQQPSLYESIWDRCAIYLQAVAMGLRSQEMTHPDRAKFKALLVQLRAGKACTLHQTKRLNSFDAILEDDMSPDEASLMRNEMNRIREKRWQELRNHTRKRLLPVPSAFYMAVAQNEQAFGTYERTLVMCDQIRETLEPTLSLGEPTAREATTFSVYMNVLNGQPLQTSVEFAKRLNAQLSAQERRYADPAVPLPTIGIELEVPVRYLQPQHMEALQALDIPCYRDGVNYNEINPHFSYSPWVQARFLFDVIESGLIPLRSRELAKGAARVADDLLLPMHINLGTELSVSKNDHVAQGRIHLVSHALLYAFSSSERIRQNEYRSTHLFHQNAMPSQKSTAHEATFRLELRAGHLVDATAYRLLAEAQCLGAMLFAEQKRLFAGPLTDREQTLVTQWNRFALEMERLQAAFGLNSFTDTSRQELTPTANNDRLQRLLDEPSFRASARQLTAKSARFVRRTAFAE